MNMQFDLWTVILVAAISLLVGYALGGLRGSAGSVSVPPSPMRPLTRGERDEVAALLAQEGMIPAIRRLRELTGAGLKEAHDAMRRLEGDLGPRDRISSGNDPAL
jgi:hypothetical protein